MPPGYNARTGVHEYGGAAFAVSPDGNLVFSDWNTCGVFSLDPASGEVQPLTEPDTKVRFASFNIHPTSPNWILAIQEKHHTTVENSVVAIDSSSKTVHPVTQGAKFYNHPQFSPQGDRVCWIQWDHPDMPWTGTKLFTADWHDGKIGSPRNIAGQPGLESIVQPRWGLDGTLFFSSDRSGYWQLYRLGEGTLNAQPLRLKGLEDADFAGNEFLLGR